MAKDASLQRAVLGALAPLRAPIHGMTFRQLSEKLEMQSTDDRRLDRELQRLRRDGMIEYRSPVIGWAITVLGRSAAGQEKS